MPDPRDQIIRSLDISKFRMILKPHMVFVCGGPSKVDSNENQSIRHLFLKRVNQKIAIDKVPLVRTEMAEDYKEWKDAYASLSIFQADIAAVSSVVLVIPESEGSIAELGYFYRDDETRDKLIAVTNNEFYGAESFIKHGIFSPMEAVNESSVLTYDFGLKPLRATKDAIDEIVSAIFDECHTSPDERAFNPDSRSGKCLLVFQLVDLFSILKLGELKKYLDEVGVEVSQTRLKQILFTLELFGYLKKQKFGRDHFYISNPEADRRVKLSNGSKTGFNYLSEKISVVSHYKGSEFRRTFDNRFKILEA